MGNQHGNSVDNDNDRIRIVMVGKTGAGKSATGNTILGEKFFKSEFSPKSLTEHCEKADGEVNGQKVAVIDTPDLFDTKNAEEATVKYITQCISFVSPGPHIFLIVIKLGRFTEEEKQTVQKIQIIFGEEAKKYSMILFTHGDRLKGKPIKEFLEKSEDLQELLAKFKNGYYVINNKVKDRSQVRKLLKKIKEINGQNEGSYYTTEMFKNAEKAIEEEKQRIPRKEIEQPTPPTAYHNDDLIKIVMLGKTGAGKSATGNTIVGKQCFKSEFCPQSLTKDCSKAFGAVDGHWVAVIDTPGLFDTKNTEEKTDKDISQSIAYASPGPHIFLIIIKLGVFTEEEKQTVQKIQKIFVGEANKYSMVLFTHGDQLKGKSIKEFLEDSKDLQEVVAKCNDQYHVFNNEEKEDRFQVTELLRKIKDIKECNGSHYTNEMFQKPERVIEEEKRQNLKEREEQNRKEQEELRKKLEEKQQSSNNDGLIRIVMLGKTGAGKSATGNTILGEKCFKSEFTPQSLTTDCEKVDGEVDGQKVAVIDTPGLFDNRNTEEETIQNIAQCIAYASPGPHIFLIVIKVDRFTEEEKQTVQKIQKIFLKEANKYSMVLFTHGDQLKGKPIEDFLEGSEDLQELVNKCNGQYHVFNNEMEDHSQVSELLEKIKKIKENNGGRYYTTEQMKRRNK